MRDTGLQAAIQAAGGVSELARRIGISQPSVSNWDCVPADRVLSVEAVTGINRALLRPDLFGDAIDTTALPRDKAGMRIIGLAGWSGSGKTTLITKVIPRLI